MSGSPSAPPGRRRSWRLPAAGLLLLLAALGGAYGQEGQDAAGGSPAVPEEPSPPEPKRPRVGTVTFIGNRTFPASRLRNILLTQPWRFWAPNRYFPEVLNQDLETLRSFYEQHGYLQARVLDARVREEPEKNVVHIEIEIAEGPLTTVGGVSISGNRLLSSERLSGQLDIRIGEPFQPPVVREDTLDLMRQYADEGYLETDVRPDIRIRPDENQAFIEFAITESEQFRIDRIRLEGMEKTRERIIQRELSFRPGEIVRYSALLESQRRLFRTGLFQSVFISPVAPESAAPGRRDILVEVQETRSIEINASVGYSTIGKLGASLEVRDTNIAGTALKAGLAGSADFQKRSVGASFTEPRLFGTWIQTDLDLRFEQLLEPSYDLLRGIANLEFGRELGERSRASLAYQYEKAAISDARISPLPVDLDSDLHSLIVSYLIDTRNDLVSPTRGFYVEWRNALGEDIPLFSREVFTFNPYFRTTATARGFFPLTPSTVLATALSGGWITHLVEEEMFPLNLRFYTGGPNSLRSFGYQQVGPQDPSGIPLGGTLSLVWNVLEVRQTIYKILGGVLFLDAGGVWARPSEFRFGDVRLGLGAGLRLNTPIGVIRLDGALKIRPREGESPGAVYLSVGQAF
jgi:outer membrane protein insertion porin family